MLALLQWLDPFSNSRQMAMSKKQTTSVQVLRPAELEPRHWLAWNRFVSDNPFLTSPFFSPHYALTVSRIVPDVFIGILKREGDPIAFLPFERGADKIAKRLRLCDYQGVILGPEMKIDIVSFLRECGLCGWEFDHLIANQEFLRPYHLSRAAAPIVDLSEGYNAYLVQRKSSGGLGQIKEAQVKMRRMEKAIGSLRFEFHMNSQSILGQLIDWRYHRYESRHEKSLVKSILESFLGIQEPDFSGILSSLHAGDKLVAAHFGLRSGKVLAHWFPAYDAACAKLSPGSVLNLKMIECAADFGIHTIDFGKGDQSYKLRWTDQSIPLAEGVVVAAPCRYQLWRALEIAGRRWGKVRDLAQRE
jgi:CelD/BcsL family acetyltransferase involved in cellulose biosynthesis